jgi:hypothetical protein
MKLRFCSSWCQSALLFALLENGWVAQAADAPSNPAARPVPPAEATLAIAAIPQSTFNVPRTPQEGRDPFFPSSTRLFAPVVNKAIPQSPAATPPGELFLMGISGSKDHRLAIINNYTFAAGESAEVHTTTGRVRVHCLEIKSDSVIIQIGDERRELHLRNGALAASGRLN